MTSCIAEFTIEPFAEGRPGRHVHAALDAIVSTGLTYELGPFATSIEGECELVTSAVEIATRAALAAGASRISVTITAVPVDDGIKASGGHPTTRTDDHPLVVAIGPLLDAVGGMLIEPAATAPGDVTLEWEGEIAAAIRVASLDGALERMVVRIEDDFGAPLDELDRVQKQAAVRMLDERGAFLLRKSINEVADLMGVSRITVYNYLGVIRQQAPVTQQAR